jgi:aspartate kinase
MIEAAPQMHPLTVTARIGQEARIVSLIGLLLQDTPGVMARMARALDRAGIEPLQTADSRISLSVLVSDAQASAAVSALHQEFVESELEAAVS